MGLKGNTEVRGVWTGDTKRNSLPHMTEKNADREVPNREKPSTIKWHVRAVQKKYDGRLFVPCTLSGGWTLQRAFCRVVSTHRTLCDMSRPGKDLQILG